MTAKATTPRIETLATDERPLLAFYRGSTTDQFQFARFYWGPGHGPRETFLPRLTKKLRPAGDQSKACRARVLLPDDAPDVLEDPVVVATCYSEDLLTDERTAYVMLTMRFPDAINTQGPFETAVSWLRAEYVQKHRVGVIAVFHSPWMASSDAPAHLHAIVLSARKLGRFGWAENPVSLASDKAAAEAKLSWESFLARYSMT